MSKYIFGLHEPGGEHLFDQTGKTGWITFTHELGRDPDNMDGHDYTPWSDRGFGIIARLNHGYHPNGTIPMPEHYPAFAQRAANFVAGSQGCSVWLISNEPNHSIERPAEQPITYESYAECYTLCRNAIKSLPGHENDQVCVAAIAPWNVETGDWLHYFEEMLLLAVEFGGVDAIALHTYTHGSDPALILDEAKMDPPYDNRLYHFRAYQDFMARIPAELRHVPVYITETDQDDEWENVNRGWVQEAYKEIDRWNRQPNTQSICCLCLYRWPHYDKYRLEDKLEVQQDFIAAMANDYEWDKRGGNDMELTNPSFEGVYTEREAGEVKVALDWVPFYSEGETAEGQGPTVRPEFKPLPASLDPLRVIDGDIAQCFFVRWNIMQAGVYQRVVGLPANTLVTFKANVQTWCSESDDPRADDGEMYFRVGLDLDGQTDPFTLGVVWSDWVRGTKDYQELSVSAITLTTNVTVFVYAWNKWKLSHNDAYVDKASLVVEQEEPPEPPIDGIQTYIDALRWDIDVLQSDLDALQAYVENSQRLCLLV